MSKPKSGKVIRIDELTFRFISEKRRRGEQITSLIRRLIGLPSRKGIVDRPTKYVLPSDMFDSIEEARGAAIMKSVKLRAKKTEEPLAVKEAI